MRTRPTTPRTGRPRKLRFKKTGRKKGTRSPAQLAAKMGRRRVRRKRRK